MSASLRNVVVQGSLRAVLDESSSSEEEDPPNIVQAAENDFDDDDGELEVFVTNPALSGIPKHNTEPVPALVAAMESAVLKIERGGASSEKLGPRPSEETTSDFATFDFGVKSDASDPQAESDTTIVHPEINYEDNNDSAFGIAYKPHRIKRVEQYSQPAPRTAIDVMASEKDLSKADWRRVETSHCDGDEFDFNPSDSGVQGAPDIESIINEATAREAQEADLALKAAIRQMTDDSKGAPEDDLDEIPAPVTEEVEEMVRPLSAVEMAKLSSQDVFARYSGGHSNTNSATQLEDVHGHKQNAQTEQDKTNLPKAAAAVMVPSHTGKIAFAIEEEEGKEEEEGEEEDDDNEGSADNSNGETQEIATHRLGNKCDAVAMDSVEMQKRSISSVQPTAGVSDTGPCVPSKIEEEWKHVEQTQVADSARSSSSAGHSWKNISMSYTAAEVFLSQRDSTDTDPINIDFLLKSSIFGAPSLKLHDSEAAGKLPFIFAQVDYDPRIPEHYSMLCFIYFKLMGRQPSGASGTHWEDIGFQGIAPQTDINRSMKMLAVLQMVHLVDQHLHFAQRLHRLSRAHLSTSPGRLSWPLFCVSIAFTKITLDVFRSGALNKECNRQKAVLNVLHEMHLACFHALASKCDRPAQDKIQADYLEEVRKMATKKPISVLSSYRAAMKAGKNLDSRHSLGESTPENEPTFTVLENTNISEDRAGESSIFGGQRAKRYTS
jgi:hypothetical protein